MNKNEIILYSVLVAIIGFFTVLLAITKYESPESIAQRIIAESGQNTDTAAQDNEKTTLPSTQFPNFGAKDIFTTIIAKPTPIPTAIPTPKPPPDLKRIVGTWKIVALLDDYVTFENTALRQTFDMKIGEVKEINYLNQNCNVKLESIDLMNFMATVSFEGQIAEIKMNF